SVHIVSATTFASCKAYPNTATASATNSKSVEASATITVSCPNLTVTKTADAPIVSAGDDIAFANTDNNASLGAGDSATLAHQLPTGSGISWSINPGYAGLGTCGIAANALTCAFGDLAAGASATVHVTSATGFASC